MEKYGNLTTKQILRLAAEFGAEDIRESFSPRELQALASFLGKMSKFLPASVDLKQIAIRAGVSRTVLSKILDKIGLGDLASAVGTLSGERERDLG